MKLIKQKIITEKIGDFCNLQQGLQVNKSERLSEQTPNSYIYITVDFLKRQENHEYIENPRNSVICNEDDILVSRTGTVGNIVSGVSGVFHNNFFKIILNKNYSKKFIYYYLKRKKIKEEMINRANGAVIPDLKHSEFLSIKFPVLDVKNQIKSADYIKQMDENLNNIKSLLEKIKIRNQYYADKLLSGELSIDEYGKIYKNTALFETFKLNDLFDFKMGQTILNKDVSEKKQNEEYVPVFSATEKDKVFGYVHISKVKAPLNENDIIISARGTIGYPKLNDIKIKASTQTTLQMVSKGIVSSYIVKKIMETKKEYYFSSEGAAVPQLTITTLSNKEIDIIKNLLPVEKFLKKLDEEKSKVEKLLELEEKRFEWLSDKLLSGEYIIED